LGQEKSNKKPSVNQPSFFEEQKQMFDNLRDGILLLREDDLLFCNSRLCSILNIKREEITLAQIIKKLSATKNPTARKNILQLSRGHQFDSFQFEVSFFPDTTSTLEIQSIEISFMGEETLQVILSDQTRELAVESELFDTLSIFNSIYNAVDDVVFIIEKSDLTLQSSNLAMEQIFKIDRASCKGKHLWDLISERDDVDKLITEINEKLPKTGALHYVFDMIRSDGEKFPALHSISEIKDCKKKVLAIMWIVSDMSHNEYLNKVLAEVETRYQVLFNRAGDATFLIDFESKQIIDANHAAEEHLGFSRMELIGKTIFSITPPARQKSLEEVWPSLVQKGSQSVRGFSLTKSKVEIPVQTSMVVTKFGSRQVVVAATRDISQQIVIEQERLRLEKLEAVRQVTGGIAHEFNQPLQGLMTIADILDLKKLNLADQQPLIKNIPPLVNRMDLLLNRMKGIVRLAVKPYVNADEILDFEQSSRYEQMLIIGSQAKLVGLGTRVGQARGMLVETVNTIRKAKSKVLKEQYDIVVCGGLCSLKKNEEIFNEIKEIVGEKRIIEISKYKKKSAVLTESELIRIIDDILA
jgi:PAS domain S-box-containing protein